MPNIQNEKVRQHGTLIKKKHNRVKYTDEIKYYSLKEIKALENELDVAHGERIQYYVIYGKRSNGKSYSVWEEMLVDYLKNGNQGVYIRRWDDEIVKSKGMKAPMSLCCNGNGDNVVALYSGGLWDTIVYKDRCFYLAKKDPNNPTASPKCDQDPFVFAMAVNTMQKDKSSGGFQKVRSVLFDEFIPTNGHYVDTDEFVTFMNCISTIIRFTNDQCKVYMCANAYSPRCMYFMEMGLKNIGQMVPGDLQLYQYGDSGLFVAVEYSDSPTRVKPTDKYFAFGNPKLDIIAGDGTWATDTYPKSPRKYTKDDIVGNFFVDYEGEMAQGDMVVVDDCSFILFHMKTTNLKDPDTDLIYSQTLDPRPNWKRSLKDTSCELTAAIRAMIMDGRCYYADNMTGDFLSQAWQNMM